VFMRASLFRNNLRIMGCMWLANLSMYSLAVIQPRRVIMGPTEYYTMISLPKPSQNLPCVSLLEPGNPAVGFLGCSPNINSSWCREHREGRLIDHITCAFPIVWCPSFMVVIPLFTHLRITFSNCSPTVDVGFVKLTSENMFFKMNIQFCCHLCCSSSVIFRNNPSNVWRSLSVTVDFHLLFLYADVFFPWFMSANITLETVALDTPNNVAVFVTDAPAKFAPTICPLSKLD
jgi:hypothetical protein